MTNSYDKDMPTRRSRVLTDEEMERWHPADIHRPLNDEPRNGFHGGGSGERKQLPPPEVNIVCINEIERREITWLWRNRVPVGKLTLICGDPGLGKSHLTGDISSRTTVGGLWPDGTTVETTGSVILFSAEDDAADTIRPRLERAGADLSKVFILESVKVWDHKSQEMRHAAFSLEEHVPKLEERINQIGDVRLIVIDPISSYTGKVDSHKNAEVRAMLMALVSLAEKYGIAVIAVTHLNKGAGGKAVYRATGSLAFAAAARSVWMMTQDLDDPDRRLLLPVKCNIAERVSGLGFSIKSDVAGSYVSWEADPVAMTADKFLAEEAKRQIKSSDDDDSARAEAIDFLKERLSSGPMTSKDLESDAKEHGIKGRTLERAVKALGIRSRKRDDGRWEKFLPDSSPPDQLRQPSIHGKHGEHGGHGGHDLPVDQKEWF